MNIPILGDLIREAGTTLRQVIPDAEARMELEYKLRELADRADARESELLKAQIDVNKEEAKSANLFVAGWRPFIGWTGGAALAYTWIVAPLFKLQALDPNTIYPIITAMLGIGAMRTFEKTRGVATSIGGRVLAPLAPQTKPQEPTPAATERSPARQTEEKLEVPKQKSSRWIND